ncbi:MAG: hypothetical protein AAF696_23135 [Bacteroidota bacterium]
MKTILISIIFLLLSPSIFSQILELEVGMKEKNLVKNTMPAKIEPNIKFLKREGNLTTFHQEQDSSYRLEIRIETEKGFIQSIHKEHVGRELESRRKLFLRFKERMSTLSTSDEWVEDEELARSSAQEYLDRGVRAKAYKHKKAKTKEILLYFHNKTDSVLIEIARNK